jgi:uncharacterized membrane protein
MMGMGLMYVLDPDRGARRRALLRDKAVHVSHVATDMLDKSARDLKYRARGVIAETKGRLNHDEVTDETLVERVRSTMGRYVAHPHAVQVRAVEGRVILSGPVLMHEIERLLAAVRGVRGVRGVESRLEIHKTSSNLPSLQGGVRRRPRRPMFLRNRWSPLERVAADFGGAGLALLGVRTRGPLGYGLTALGGLVLLRSVLNKPVTRTLGLDGGRPVLSFQKTIHVDAPVEEVFAFWSDFENLPRFMAHVREIRRKPGGRWNWIVAGPAGIPVGWDATVTRFEQDKLIAWQSVPEAVIKNAGVVHFDKEADGTTRVDVKLSYTPPLGALGHIVASFFRADPKHAMDDDLLRFQSLLEKGKTSAHGEHVTRDEIDAHTLAQLLKRSTGNDLS